MIIVCTCVHSSIFSLSVIIVYYRLLSFIIVYCRLLSLIIVYIFSLFWHSSNISFCGASFSFSFCIFMFPSVYAFSTGVFRVVFQGFSTWDSMTMREREREREIEIQRTQPSIRSRVLLTYHEFYII